MQRLRVHKSTHEILDDFAVLALRNFKLFTSHPTFNPSHHHCLSSYQLSTDTKVFKTSHSHMYLLAPAEATSIVQ